ncbi:MAG: hypothetical protein NVSMB42_06690 [Herpetosiphon sp.]
MLRDIGLTQHQALEATRRHGLTRAEAEQWRDWLQRLDPVKTRPVAILAAAIKQQRLPPQPLAAIPSVDRPPEPTDDGTNNATVSVPGSDGSVERTTLSDLWQQVQVTLKHHLDDTDFETWIKPTTLLDLDDQTAVVGTPNVFAREALERYRDTLAAALTAELQRPVAVMLAIQPATLPARYG